MTDTTTIQSRSPMEVDHVALYDSLEELAEQQHKIGGSACPHQPYGLDGTAAWYYESALHVALSQQNVRIEDQTSAIHWLVRDGYLAKHSLAGASYNSKPAPCYSTTNKGLADWYLAKLASKKPNSR